MNKEGFILYKSFYEPIKHLSREEKGELLEALFLHQINPDNPVGFNSQNVQMAFHFFINQFRLDERKYEKTVQRNRTNGLKGGRPKITQINPNNPVGFQEPKKADKDKDKEKDNINKDNKSAFLSKNYKTSEQLERFVNGGETDLEKKGRQNWEQAAIEQGMSVEELKKRIL